MQVLVRDGLGLDLARVSSGSEDRVALDVTSLLQSLCNDAVAAGYPVTVSGGSGVIVTTRPQALARCASKILDNALKSAGAADLGVKTSGGVVIQVTDVGPGIPPEKLQEVTKPFVRL